MPIDKRRYGARTPFAFDPGEAAGVPGICDGIAAFRLTRGFGCGTTTGLSADFFEGLGVVA